LFVNGKVVDQGKLTNLKIKPRMSKIIALPCRFNAASSDEVHLSIFWKLKRKTWFGAKSHLVAWDQIELKKKPSRAKIKAQVKVNSQHTTLQSSTRSEFEELLVAPVQLCIWRAAVDNDGYKLMPELFEKQGTGGQALRNWQRAGIDKISAEKLVNHKVSRSVSPDGRSVLFEHEVVVPKSLADLPRVGVSFALPKSFEQIRWFGRGPGENYPDRKSASLLGVWSGSPDQSPYLIPQEFGLRTDTRWLELISTELKKTILIEVMQPNSLHFSATNYSANDLFVAENEVDLKARPELVVHLDVAHRGLGTASCGPDVLPQYRLSAGKYSFTYQVTVS
jgi:beta-galactosidase